MEAGEEEPLKPFPHGVDSMNNVEQGEPDKPPTTERLASCLLDKTETEKLLCSAEETMEVPGSTDCCPKSNEDQDGSLPVSHVNEYKAVMPGFGTTISPPVYHWGEEMLEDSDLHNCNLSKTGASQTPHLWGEYLDNPGSKLASGQCIPTNGSLVLRTGSNKSGTNEPSEVCNGKPHLVPAQDGIPIGEEASNAKHSHCNNGKPESLDRKSVEDEDPALLAMFRTVANSRLAVRSQQKDEPDFTPSQKLAILQELYHAKPLVFLERFRTALREEHLPCFLHLSGSYEADFYCAEVRRAGLGKTRRTRVRNKRYAALQQLIKGGEYFSDEQMRSRDPLLYEQYIGQYLSDEELQALGSCKLEAACSLSGVLMDSYQEQVIQQRLLVQQEQEEACEEEEEEDDTDDEDKEDEASDPDKDEWVPDQDEKILLREEFTSRMYQRFLDGKDRDFDYSEVDENPDFDNLDIVSRDEEERYFDREDPEEADAMEAE
nr:coiled-coil domain-containing protein 97 [Anolis sagrei ordinatus]